MFSNNAYANVWEKKEVKTKDGRVFGYDVRISTSTPKDKNAEKKEYVQDFNHWCRFAGKAFDKIKDVEVGKNTRIKLTNCGVSTNYVKERKVTYYNFTVFDFDTVENKQANADGDYEEVEQLAESDLPF